MVGGLCICGEMRLWPSSTCPSAVGVIAACKQCWMAEQEEEEEVGKKGGQRGGWGE